MHEQAFDAAWGTIRFTNRSDLAVLIERNRRNASMAGRRFIDVPCIISGISRKMGRIAVEGNDGLAIEWSEIRNIAFVEGLGVFSQNHCPIFNRGTDRDARSIAPDEFLLHFGRTIRLLLIG